MKVLVTGALGFIGKHMCLALKEASHDVLSYDISNTEEELISFVKEASYIIHLAGINRPLTNEEFYNGNTNFTIRLVDYIKKYNKDIPIIMSSSTQASLDNDYGKSKKQAEDYLLNSGLNVYVYRLHNVFGKWCKPNYNSAAATFCYNIAHNLDISIRDRNYIVHYNYIDDIVSTFLNHVNNNDTLGSKDILTVYPIHDCSLGRLADLLYYFKSEVESPRHLPILKDIFEYKLFVTFLDYLKDESYSYNSASDQRGSFTEIYKNKEYGQISINMAYPNITKGGHYHKYKKEIFYTVIGECLIRQRNIVNNDRIEDKVSEDNPKLVDIRVGYTHDITNIGNKNSYTIMWISEIYNPETHDTYREDVDLK